MTTRLLLTCAAIGVAGGVANIGNAYLFNALVVAAPMLLGVAAGLAVLCDGGLGCGVLQRLLVLRIRPRIGHPRAAGRAPRHPHGDAADDLPGPPARGPPHRDRRVPRCAAGRGPAAFAFDPGAGRAGCAGGRPHLRNYSVRALRRDGTGTGTEIDIDIVRHEGGIASTWAERVEPGTEIAVLDEGIGFAPPADAESFLLVGDETALPAIAGICASLPDGARGVAMIEIPDVADRQGFPTPIGVDVRWLPRTHADRPGSVALAHVRESVPAAGVYAYAAGEAALATGVRRHLVTHDEIPKSRIAFCGYWRLPAR